MPYVGTNWVDSPSTSTPITATRLNNMEAGITAAYTQGTGTLVNADIASGAAIAYAKLALALGIVNGDISASAAIALSKLADPGTGNVVTSAGAGAIAAKPPGFEIGYDQITSTVNIASTTEGSPTTIISGTAHTYEAVPYLFTFSAPQVVLPSTLSGSVTCLLIQDGTSIGRLFNVNNIVAGVQQVLAGSWPYRFTPSAGSHTYGIAMYASSTTGTPSVTAQGGGASTYIPASLRVTKC